MKSFTRLARNTSRYFTSPAGILQLAVVLLVSGGATALFLEFRSIKRRADAAYEQSRADVSAAAIDFRIVPSPAESRDVRLIQSVADVRALADFDGSVFAATAGGLVRLAADGRELRRFSVADGLPESDLTALAVYRRRLFIGTGASGIVVFDGERFSRVILENHEIKSVSALFADDATLLAGTSGGGLLEFDGARFTELRAANERLENVVFLARRNGGGDGGVVFAGTFADGLWLGRGGRWRHVTRLDGLESNRVVGATMLDSMLYVLTDRGLSRGALAGDSRFATVASIPAASGMSVRGDVLRVVADDGAVREFDAKTGAPSTSAEARRVRDDFAGARLVAGADDDFVCGDGGVFRLTAGGAARTFFEPANEPLAENTVAALAVDAHGDLWCGGFRRGIDVLSTEGGLVRRLSADEFRETNTLAVAASGAMIVASNRGATLVGDDSRPRGAASGELPSRAVTAGLESAGTRFFATARGLVIDDGVGIRVLSAVNGLPSNSVTALVAVGGGIFAGTTGGLAEIRDGRVLRVFKPGETALANGWVTALASDGRRVFIGTFGGGAFMLDESGALSPLGDARFAVNPNALAVGAGELYAGTTDGVRVWSFTERKWRRVVRGLPSPNVLAVAARNGKVYLGTNNGVAVGGRGFVTEQ